MICHTRTTHLDFGTLTVNCIRINTIKEVCKTCPRQCPMRAVSWRRSKELNICCHGEALLHCRYCQPSATTVCTLLSTQVCTISSVNSFTCTTEAKILPTVYKLLGLILYNCFSLSNKSQIVIRCKSRKQSP